MREKEENAFRETETAFAFAVLLINILMLAEIFAIIWLLQLLISPNSPLSAVPAEMIWR